ncbi:MAG: malate dehydrogenase [Deltaproteobacteria bacterium]|nr:malate dehydrogenase [Deltaproteobacteria bacterium]
MVKRKKIALIGAGQIGGNLALLAAQKQLGDVVLYDVEKALGLAKGKALDLNQLRAVDGLDSMLSGTSDFKDLEGADVAIVTAGIPRKPGMSREDLTEVNLGIVKDVAPKLKQYCPNAFSIVLTNPLDAMVHALWKLTGFAKKQVVGMAGVLDTSRFRFFISEAVGCSIEDVHALVLGGHGDDMVPLVRQCSVGGIPLAEVLSPDKIDAIVKRTREGGAELVKLYQTGSAYFAPAASAMQMAESYLLDRKRVLPAAALLEGEYGIQGYFIGVPVQIGAGGVERVFEVKLNEDERAMLERSFISVKKTVETIRW